MNMKKILFSGVLIFIVLFLLSIYVNKVTQKSRIKNLTTLELINIVKNQDSDYLAAIEELGNRPEDSNISAPILANAFKNNRRDSHIVGIAIARLGTSAKAIIPDLQTSLKNEYPGTRAYAAYALGSIGDSAICSVPTLALLLWDEDGAVRSSAAWAISKITKNDLVSPISIFIERDPYSIVIDKPDGSVTGKARNWWDNEGKLEIWPESCF